MLRARLRSIGIALVWASSVSSPQSFDSARASIQRRITDGQVPSIAIAVARKGSVLCEEGFGLADQERKIPATSDTIYSVASISKPFTATGLMTLVQKGQIDLDAPINKYLRGSQIRALVGDAKDATVKRVANHTSGLPLHGNFFYEDELLRPPPIEQTIRRYGLLFTAPGEVWQYSNLGYGILGHVIELVSQKPYADFMENQVFRPLGLDHTSVGSPIRAGRVYAVRYGAENKIVPNFAVDHVGASMIWSSVHDLVEFGIFHSKAHLGSQEAILSDASIDAMQTPGTGAAAHYGIGWNIGEAQGRKVIVHGGDMEGVGALLLILPSEELVVAAICNRRADPSPVVDDILEVILPGWKNHPPPPVSHPHDPLPTEFIGKWFGKISTYSGKEAFVLDVATDGTVRAKAGRQPERVVQRVSSDGTRLTGEFEGFIDTSDARRHPNVVYISLRLRNGVLQGSATAFSKPPGGWMGNALTSWVSAKKGL